MVTPRGDAGDGGDAISLLSNSEKNQKKREGKQGDPERVVEGGKTASPASPPSSEPAEREKKPRLAEQIIAIVEGLADLFHDGKGDTFATVADARGVQQTIRLDTRAVRAWVAFTAREVNGESIGPSIVDETLLALQGIALYKRPERQVHVRVAEHGGSLYVDLGDATGACIECRPGGWEIIERAPADVKFIRPSGLRALPRPVRGGKVDELRQFVNVATDDHFHLLLAWLVAAYRPGRPFCILAIQGEQGSAKTTTARLIRRNVDPNFADVRAPPKNEDDLMVTAHNSHVVSFDNLSGVKPWLSDALCRIATGGGLSKRAHYANADEVKRFDR